MAATTGAKGFDAGGMVSGIASMVPGSGTKGSNIASQSLFTAASAANAIPVAGQFVSAGLAIAGLFVKIFAGRKKKKREAARKAQEAKMSAASTAVKAGTQSGASGGIGTGQEGAAGMAGSLQPVSGPQAPSFSSWGGGAAPSVQPVQQALNNKTGM